MVAASALTYSCRWLCFVAGLFTFLSRVGQFMVFSTFRRFMAWISDEVRVRPSCLACKAGGVLVS
jgi:hypothetical protein